MGLILAKLYIIEEEKEKAVEEFDIELPRATPNPSNRAWIERLVSITKYKQSKLIY